MAPRKATTNGAVAKSSTTKTAATKKATTAKTAAAPKKSSATAAAKPAASRKRKLEDEDEDDAEESSGSQPKKQKTASTVTKAAKTAATKKAPGRPAKAAAKPVAKTARKASKEPTAVPSVESRPVDIDGDKENSDPSGKAVKTDRPKRGDTTVSAEPAPAPRPIKKAKTTVAKKPAARFSKTINNAPADPLDIFVFGEGSSGELGLGSVRLDGKKPIDVKRPRLNPKLSAKDVGVVQIACGGMHSIALTKDNKILTWGVNDQGALGRDTNWDGGLKDAGDSDSDDEDEDDTGINPRESTPGEIILTDVVEGTVFVQVAASDSASFALTADGRVYGWGTFRASDGILGFTKDIVIQRTPMLLPEPVKVKQIATGSNHVLALDERGKVFTWGCPEQNQLGRRCVQRDLKESALRPGGVGFKRGVKIQKVSCGSYHSFALDTQGRVYAWGLNNFAELGVEEGAGDSDAAVLDATLISTLLDHTVVDICGGEHHSLACTKNGELLTWGRIDGHQVGLATEAYNEDNTIYDEHKNPRILKRPTVIPGVPHIVSVAAGTDNSFALTEDGKAYSWGFSANYQTGQGTEDDIETPTLIDNTAVRPKKLTYAGAGGQFSVLASVADVEMVNGI